MVAHGLTSVSLLVSLLYSLGSRFARVCHLLTACFTRGTNSCPVVYGSLALKHTYVYVVSHTRAEYFSRELHYFNSDRLTSSF